MIKKLAHVCLFAPDLAACEAFYCGALGLTKRFEFLREGRRIGFYLEIAEDQFVEVFERAESVSGPQGIGHFCLEVDDLAAWVDRLASRGIVCTEPKLGADQSWQAWCRDPAGVDIEFHQYTPASSQHTGRDCVANW